MKSTEVVRGPSGDGTAGSGRNEPHAGHARQWKLPALLDHFNRRDLKIFLRCWVATWVATLLIFIQPSLERIGVATFFAALTLYIAPPANVLFLYLLSAASALLGMCLAWLWGLLTMKAALAARPAHDTRAKLAALQQAALQKAHESGGSPQDAAEVLIFDGFMLDARVTTVYYVMIVVFIYALARLRLTNPRFSFMQIFGTIAVDVFLLNGPSLPSFNGSIGGILVKPGAIGIGLGAVSCLLFFPQSASFTIMDKMQGLLRSCAASISATEKRLRQQPLELAGLNGQRVRMIGAWKALQPLMPLLPLDVSRCCWSADDLIRLHELFRDTLRKSVALIDFHIASLSARENEQMLKSWGEAEAGTMAHLAGPGHHHLQELAGMMNALHSVEHGELPDRTTDILRDATSELLDECSASFDLAARCLSEVNSCRWIKRLSPETANSLCSELQERSAALRRLREQCKSTTPDALLTALDVSRDDQDGARAGEVAQADHTSLRDFMASLALEQHICDVCIALEVSLKHLAVLLTERRNSRLWMPTKLRNALSWIFRPKTSDPAVSDGDEAVEGNAGASEAEKAAQRRIRESKGRDRARNLRRSASARRSGLSKAIIATYRWLTNPAGMYAMRLAVVTIATSIPSAIPHSAGFFYREKGIWAVITAQLTLLPYMADFVLSIFSRAVGTVAGGLIGMAAWYIGSGSGDGNPYGLGAITALATAVLVWLRIRSPHMFAVAGIMSGATFVLVVGFSYDNRHIDQHGLPGQGYEAFWKRVVTVFLGLLAAAVVHVFPKPPSATSHVCHVLAKSMRRMSDQYAILLLSQKHHPDEDDALCAVAELESLHLVSSLSGLTPSIHVLKFEMSFGPFDQKTLHEALEGCRGLNQALSRLLSVVHTLPPGLKKRFVAVSGMLDDHVIGDIMAVLHIIQQSFENGAPLPERLPTPLTRTFYSAWRRSEVAAVDRDLVRQEGYCQYCIAISAYLKFLSAVDNLILVLAQALGESHILFAWCQASDV